MSKPANSQGNPAKESEGSSLRTLRRDQASGRVEGVTEVPQAAAVSGNFRTLVEAMVRYNASDLHIKVGRPPVFRVAGRLVAARTGEVTQEQIKTYFSTLLSEKQAKELEVRKSVDFSFRFSDLGRFRCNAYYQRGQQALAIRTIPLQVPSLSSLGIPSVAQELVSKNRGLLIVTGATGMGKSTTLAALIQHLNETQALHILTLEDPVEFIFTDAQSIVTQREVGVDTPTLEDGLISALRQDPDVIVIGELRDRKMMEIALAAAETGHLVITTLHTSDARSAIDRLIDVFPAESKNQIRIQLASALVGVIAQQLIPSVNGDKRILATEVLVKSPHIEQLILKNELDQIGEAIGSSNTYYNMHTMNQSLEALIRSGQITEEVALQASASPEDLRLVLAGLTRERKF